MKKVYVIKGSEDGNIGVAGNVKLAYEMASQYVCYSADGEKNKTLMLSYEKVCKKLKDYNNVSLTDHEAHFGDATIEKFYLNQV